MGLIFTFCIFINVLLLSSTEQNVEPTLAKDAVVATVAEEPIYAGEVQRLQEKAARGKRLSPSAVRLLQAQVLEEIVNRRLILASAKRAGTAASDKEIDKALAELKSSLAGQRKTLEGFLKEQSVAEKELRRQLAWNVVWERLLARYITPERVQKYFDAHRREFDGTELSVSHILLAPTPEGEGKGSDGLIARADSLREELLSGKISFAEAATKYSAGPSRNDAGKLGFIGRHGPMDNAFSRAAFALNAGEISPPVRTSFGVHLILCEEIRPGKKSLAEVEFVVRDSMARELLEKLAQAERAHTAVKYSERFPRLDPKSRTVVEP